MRSSTGSTSSPRRSGRVEGYPADLAARASVSAGRLKERGIGESRLAIILGSGLEGVASRLEAPRCLPYRDIEGMASPHTEGHGGLFHSGKLCGKPVIVLEGRTHFYEGEDAAGKIAFPFFLLCALGVRSVFLTCAAGAVSPGLGEGDLLLVRDHVNLMQRNPLRDLGARGFGRFVDMEGAYDGEMCAVLLEAAGSLGHPLKEGVLAAVLGPSYETPAELCALGAMGVDAVTMSTVPEVILARFTGLRVACVSAITNSALEREATAPLTHRWVLEKAAAMSSNLGELLGAAVRGFNFEH